jgi:peptidase C25-like protein
MSSDISNPSSRWSRTGFRGPWDSRALVLLFTFLPGLGDSALGMTVLSGSYTGDGSDSRSIAIGFQPDVVIIKGNTAQEAIIRTSTMSGDSSKQIAGASGVANFTDRIQAFNSTGFEVGTDADVNGNGIVYYWVAMTAVAGELKVGTYSGNGADSRSITGVGFQPDWVAVFGESTSTGIHHPSSLAGDNSLSFRDVATASDRIQALQADGFQIGTNGQVNTNGVAYHYIAVKAAAGKFAVGSFTGDGTDNRSITGVGFKPEWVLVKDDGNHESRHKTGSTGPSTDTSLLVNASANAANNIQALEADGFQVGSGNSVNINAVVYHYIAFARSSPTAVHDLRATASRHEGGVLVEWRTSREVDNLGFNLYRAPGESSGDGSGWIRLNPDLISGSALLDGRADARRDGQVYRWFDPLPESEDVWYSIEDVDLSGRKTRHGPFAAVPASGPPPGFLEPRLLSRTGLRGLRSPSSNPLRSKASRREALIPRRGDPRTVPSLRLSPPAWERAAVRFTGRELKIQWGLAARPALKIGIREAGWYRIGQEELVAAGLDPAVDPRRLRLYMEGWEVGVIISGQDDGRLDPGDALWFYGTGLDTPSTDERVYWLLLGDGCGKRIRSVRGAARQPGPASFPFTVTRKDRVIYFAAVKNGERENFFGPVVSEKGAEQTLRVGQLDGQTPHQALLSIALQGVTDIPEMTPDHEVELRLNGTGVGQTSWDGRTPHTVRIPVDSNLLVEGENLLELFARGDPSDVSVVDQVQLTYLRRYEAEGDELQGQAEGSTAVTVSGFNSPAIRVFDITDPCDLMEIQGAIQREASPAPAGNARRAEGGDERYTVKFAIPRPGLRRFLALGPLAVKRSPRLARNWPSSWQRKENQADLVMIAPRSLLGSVAALKAYHESQGRQVALVDIEDIYDEYSFGEKSPAAIRDFLQRTRGWRLAPRSLLLLGDATFDPRNYLGFGDLDLVPTWLVETAYLETASDDWFADWNGDGVPDIAVGRLPARSTEEMDRLVAKTLQVYRSARGPGLGRSILVADRSDDFDFGGELLRLGQRLPEGREVEVILSQELGRDTAREKTLQALKQGGGLVVYLGHGSVESWRGLLTSDDAGELKNQDLFFAAAMTCLNGFFHDLYIRSLAESLLRAPEGGAAAVLASSGLCFPDGQVEMTSALLDSLWGDSPPSTLGEACREAKAKVHDLDTRRTFIFFGDPLLPRP